MTLFTRLNRCWLLVVCALLTVSVTAQPENPPTLTDFWEGRAAWVVDVEDTGLPIGESDTLYRGDGVYWSYLHASNQSAGVIDQCGAPAAFPGCLTRWESTDGGETFTLPVAVCSLSCMSCPCQDERDHVGLDQNGIPRAVQQYPRVFDAGDLLYMAYEWNAQVMLRTSTDGITWSDWDYLIVPGGTWSSSYAPCTETEKIGAHPFIRGEIWDCLVGAPPGLFVEGDTLYVFVAAGSAPGNMRCYKGNRYGDLGALRLCNTDPLFTGAAEYGPTDVVGEAANAYFDFRTVSSADVLQDGEWYYMAYEGIRGPEQLEIGMDTQFALGFARAQALDSAWEKYPDNPVVMDMSFNVGIGHADLLVVDGVTYMYTATSETTRGRYRLDWITD